MKMQARANAAMQELEDEVGGSYSKKGQATRTKAADRSCGRLTAGKDTTQIESHAHLARTLDGTVHASTACAALPTCSVARVRQGCRVSPGACCVHLAPPSTCRGLDRSKSPHCCLTGPRVASMHHTDLAQRLHPPGSAYPLPHLLVFLSRTSEKTAAGANRSGERTIPNPQPRASALTPEP